jgi:hypothetical protein
VKDIDSIDDRPGEFLLPKLRATMSCKSGVLRTD